MREPAGSRRVGRLGDEEAPQLAHEERGVARVRDDEVEHPVDAEAPAVAEDALDAAAGGTRVEPDALEPPVLPLRTEAGQRARRLADVALGVAAAEGEELHQ